LKPAFDNDPRLRGEAPAVQRKIEELRLEFERCWPWLEASLEPFALRLPDGKVWFTHEKKHVWESIIVGKVFFWPGQECVMLTEFRITPTGIKEHHVWLAGGKLQEIIELTPKTEEWGRQNGCHCQTGTGRRGWFRVLEGYKDVGARGTKNLI
jgi:hypothetical protein